MIISHVHCRVRDLVGAVEWFESRCGVVPSFSDARMAVLLFGAFTLILDAASEDSVATIGFHSVDCDADFAALVARGARALQPPQDRPYGARVAYLQGPGALTIEMEQTTKQTTRLHEDKFLKVFWDESTRIIGIDWKETTSSMTDEEFKAELTLFAGQVEQKKARGILVDVSRFRHRPAPDVQPWRIRNISNRYSGAGVARFAFLFPEGAQIPPMMNQSSPGENFLTRAFTDRTRAVTWLGGRDDL